MASTKVLSALGLVAAALTWGCSSTTVESEPASSSSSASSGGETFCTPGSTTSCTCHAISSPGVMTCLGDGSAYGDCTEQDGGTCACPAGRGDGCCPGDGLCCTCVQGCPGHEFTFPDPVVDALIACVCAEGVCATECETECAGGGIGAACAPCVELAGANECAAEYQACGGM